MPGPKRKWLDEIQENWEYRKASWFIYSDTGSRWMLGTNNTTRLFDIRELTIFERSTTSLIEHLCRCDDELANSEIHKF